MKKADEIYLLKKINEAKKEYSESDDLANLEITFKDIDFHFKNPVQLIESGLELFFSSCAFSGARVEFIISRLSNQLIIAPSIEFRDCKINTDVFIMESKLYCLVFTGVNITSKNFHISSNDLEVLSIGGTAENFNEIESLILKSNKITNYTDITFNSFKTLYIDECNFQKEFTLNVNKIERLEITKSNFKGGFDLWRSVLGDFSIIKNSSLGEVKAKHSNFGIEMEFRDVDFLGKVDFTNLESNKTNLRFKNCVFQKNTYFDNSKILNLEFSSVVFERITSFQQLNCLHLIKFTNSYFEKIGYFQEIKIGSENSIDTATIQIIKGQLLKSESKIDYLKYNALEQRKHLQNLTRKDADFYILSLNSKSNDFDRNWFKGLKFTFKTSLFFFLIMIMVNSCISSNYPLIFDVDNPFAPTSTILAEYLIFTFSLGLESKEFQSNGYLYLIFIISKIFIGYGIYQTITAFRKYGKV